MKKIFLFFIFHFYYTIGIFEKSYQNPKGRYYNFQDEKEDFFNFSYLKHAFFAIFRSLKSHLRKFFYQPAYVMPTHSFVYPDPNKLVIIPVGHATVLICYKNYFIITDPIFGDVQSGLLARYAPCTIDYTSLPPIDIILISHNHLDHCDTFSIKHLIKTNPLIKIFVPTGDTKLMQNLGAKYVKSFDWWENEIIYLSKDQKKIDLTFVPAYHSSGRNPFTINQSLWGGWIIKIANKTLYHVGDSGYQKHFSLIEKKCGPINYVFLPLGPGEPRSVYKNNHLDAQECIQVFEDLNKPYVIPIHWGIFDTGSDEIDEQAQKFFNLMIKNGYKEKLCTQKIGDPILTN